MAEATCTKEKHRMPESRVRKAWRVTVEGWDEAEFYFAHTAGEARMACWRALDRERGLITKITARRWKDKDERLPVRSPIADDLSEKEIHCLLHAFGVKEYEPWKAGYRDYFYTSASNEKMQNLVRKGLMHSGVEPCWGSHGHVYFHLTELGKHVALSLTPLYSAR